MRCATTAGSSCCGCRATPCRTTAARRSRARCSSTRRCDCSTSRAAASATPARWGSRNASAATRRFARSSCTTIRCRSAAAASCSSGCKRTWTPTASAVPPSEGSTRSRCRGTRYRTAQWRGSSACATAGGSTTPCHTPCTSRSSRSSPPCLRSSSSRLSWASRSFTTSVRSRPRPSCALRSAVCRRRSTRRAPNRRARCARRASWRPSGCARRSTAARSRPPRPPSTRASAPR
mmetsp:Transcript_1916/g.5198  ORF Transcript_1916/g.5198 Transcript_1916/m.5198 type:complete len:234 (+) Transcript_1916:342-1043(+)